MKTQLHLNRFSVILLVSILLGSYRLSAQCSADFTYTLGAAGSITLASTSTGTTANTRYDWNVDSITYYNNWPDSYTMTAYDNHIYTIQLLITDSTTVPACYSSITKTVGITNAPCNPVGGFPSVQSENGVRVFYGNPGYAGYTHVWDFGDGSTSTLTNPSHTYAAAGNYTVSLISVSYGGTCTYTTVETISVTIATCSVNADYSYTVNAGGQVNFESTSTGTNSSSVYYWQFHDGSSEEGGAAVSHTFTGSSFASVTLLVYDTLLYNCLDSIVYYIPFSGPGCNANSSFALNKDTTQLLSWQINPIYPIAISAAEWSWGDGTASLGLYPSHTYSSAGLYNICMSVTVSCGATYSVCSSSSIYKMSNTNAMVSVNVADPHKYVGIQSFSQDAGTISISPNPTTGSFNLNMSGIDAGKPVEINIMNLLGETVYKEKIISESTSFNKPMSADKLASGTYFVKVIADTKMQVVKMIVSN